MKKEQAKLREKLHEKWAQKAEQKLIEKRKELENFRKNKDFTEPIKIGHHSQRRHEKMFERRDNLIKQTIELENKIKTHLEKAKNLKKFANRNKGDAERERQEKQKIFDEKIKLDSQVSCLYGKGKIIKILSKGCRILFDPGFEMIVRKDFLTILD